MGNCNCKNQNVTENDALILDVGKSFKILAEISTFLIIIF